MEYPCIENSLKRRNAYDEKDIKRNECAGRFPVL